MMAPDCALLGVRYVRYVQSGLFSPGNLELEFNVLYELSLGYATLFFFFYKNV